MLRLALLLTLAAPMARAQDCRTVAIEPDTGEGEVSGEAPEGGAACFVLDLAQGERARIQVLDGEVAFAIDGVIEGQDDYAFAPKPGVYRIRVAPLGPAPEPFVLSVSLADAPEETDGGWRIEEGEGRAGGLAWIGEEGGPSFALACTASDPRLAMTYDGLGTAALAEASAGAAPATVEITVGDEVRRHSVELTRYDGFDRYWEVAEGLGERFLADFAAGAALRLVDADGASAGEVPLAGSARLREAIARECGL